MNLNLRNNSLKEDGCCFQSRNKGWKSNLTTFVLFMAILFTNAIYAATPTVSSFFPASGAQGQVVTIIGTNFTGTTAVSFGLTPAASFTVVNDNTISAVVGAGSTGSVRVTNPSGFGQKSGFTFFPAPSCNLSGILKACLADGNIAITTTVQFSTGEPTLNYSFPAGPQNTTGASIVSTGPFIYDPVNDLGTQTTIINPGTSGGQILYQLNVLNDGGECTCSKSITIIDLGLEAYFNPITCYGGTTNLFVDATSSGSSKYTFTLQPGNIVIGPQSNPSVEFQNIPAGNYTVTVVDNNGCSKQTEVTITQPPLNPVVLNCPENKTETSCKTQEEINASFAAWLESFSYTGGTNPVLATLPASPTAPSTCASGNGNSVQVTWTVTDDCGQPQSCTRTFTVTPFTPVNVEGPESVTASACDYANQAAVDTAFAAWVAQFQTINDGCDATAQFNISEFQAPRLCDGGSVSLTYSIADNCSQDSASATFTITPSSQITFNCGDNVSVPACSSQEEVNSAWSAFLASTTANGGCNGVLTNNAPSNPPSACGGYIDVTWTYSVNNQCGQSSDCEGEFKTFTQGGYGTSCNGNNPGCYRDANFAGAFPNGLVVGCGNNKLTFTSSSAIENYLPAGGSSSVITSSAVNPTSSRGVLSGQLVALTLSAGFDAYDPNFSQSNTSLGSLTISSGTFAGMTVSNFLQIANDVIGGCSTAYSLSQINAAATAINENFDNGTVDRHYLNCSGQNSSNNTVTCTKRFTVQAPAPVVFNCGNNVTVAACSTQSQVNSAWNAFLASTTASGGCGGTLTNNAPANPPSICGGYVDVTWTYTVDSCGQESGCGNNNTMTCTKRFTVQAPAPVAFAGANDITIPSCSTQSQVNAAWAAFKSSVTATGGCGGTLTVIAPANPPSICGGYADVTWKYTTSSCGQQSGCGNSNFVTITKRFTVASPSPVVFSGANNVTLPACSTQAEVNAAWAAFKSSVTATGGCGGVLTVHAPAYPPSICGGYADVTWKYTTSSCGQQSGCGSYNYVTITKRFRVSAPSPVVFSGANNVTLPACSTQSEVNAAWAAFKSSVTATGGCGGTLTVIAPANPPSICGGYADVTWKYTTSSCGQQSGCGSTNYVTVTKRFRVSAPSPVVLSGANNVTVPACSSQSQVNAAWAAFKSSVTATGGCGGTLTNNAPVNPPSSCGGYVDVTWTYNVSGCGQQSGCGSSNAVTVTKRFTVTAPAPVVFSGANNVTVAACSTQAQINAAWAAFKCSVTATGGCGGTLTNNAPANPPSSCGGYVDVTWTYNVSGCGPQSGCGSSNTMSVTKRFTVASSPAVTFKCGGNVTMPACSTQAQINAAWSSFLCSTTVSGGCYGGTLTNNAPANPPSACGGYVDVTWTYTTPGGCGTQSCTKRFTVASGAAVDVTGPSSVTYNGCNFTSQYALDCAFANWLSQFRTLNAGCPAPGCGPNGNTAVFSGSPRVAPRLIYGGSVCVTYSISGNCNQDSVTATFTVTRPQNCYTTCKTTDEKSEMVKGLTVKAYPNPFSEVFNISLTTSSDEKVEVSVFDLTGKQLERREVSPLEVSELQIGDRYPSGVYNVIVTQGDEVKTLKVVKR